MIHKSSHRVMAITVSRRQWRRRVGWRGGRLGASPFLCCVGNSSSLWLLRFACIRGKSCREVRGRRLVLCEARILNGFHSGGRRKRSETSRGFEHRTTATVAVMACVIDGLE